MMSRKASEAQRWGAQHVVGIQSEQTPCTLLRKFAGEGTGHTMSVQEEQANKVVIQATSCAHRKRHQDHIC
jgi:hypothetical protein